VQEAIRIGLGLKERPSAKDMMPIAEPWRPVRGAAAHLWWAYYKVVKKREGVLADSTGATAPSPVSNGVSNKRRVAKPTSGKVRITAKQKSPGST
jgi:DNA-3-methyladenine glycosylase II